MIDEVQQNKYTEQQKNEIFHLEFHPYVRPMYNFAYRLTLDGDDAKDLCKTRIWRRIAL